MMFEGMLSKLQSRWGLLLAPVIFAVQMAETGTSRFFASLPSFLQTNLMAFERRRFY